MKALLEWFREPAGGKHDQSIRRSPPYQGAGMKQQETSGEVKLRQRSHLWDLLTDDFAGGIGGWHLTESPIGDYVRHDDYTTLLHERDAAHERERQLEQAGVQYHTAVADAQTRIAALVAQRDGLREALANAVADLESDPDNGHRVLPRMRAALQQDASGREG